MEKYKGICDASAGIAISGNAFVVANDEDNKLLLFQEGKPEALQTVKLADIFKGEIFDGDDLEIDLEGATRIGDKIFWIGSHSTNKNGKARPARHRLFAMQIDKGADGTFSGSRIGNIYTTLIGDIENDPRFAKYDLSAAKAIEPKAIGGLSIEGLTATPEGGLLIGFRNPLSGGTKNGDFMVGGKALIINILNPVEVINGNPAIFGDPIELDLGGYGIRDLEYNPKEQNFLIVAGPYHENEETETHKQEVSRIYSYSGKAEDMPEVKDIDLTGFNIEGAFFMPQSNRLRMVSDDGKKPACSETDKSFRSIVENF